MFFSKLVILVSISSSLFSRFLVSLHWVEHVPLTQRSFLPTFWSLLLSIHQIHSLSSFVPLLVRSCDPLEKRLSGFECFHPFCTGFFPSLWIYLPVVFAVSDFQMESLSGSSFCLWWCYSFQFFSFPSKSGPSTVGLLEVYSRPCLPGDHLRRLQNCKGFCQFLLLLSSSQKNTSQMSA